MGRGRGGGGGGGGGGEGRGGRGGEGRGGEGGGGGGTEIPLPPTPNPSLRILSSLLAANVLPFGALELTRSRLRASNFQEGMRLCMQHLSHPHMNSIKLLKCSMESLTIFLFYVKRWLDKLGIAAALNHTRVLRQSFVGVHYSLLDSDQKPLPVRQNYIIT